VPAFRGRLVDAHAAHGGEIHLVDGCFDIVMHDAPELRVVLTEDTRCGGDRHVHDQRHGERFEQQ
jgi:hypothetical protein